MIIVELLSFNFKFILHLGRKNSLKIYPFRNNEYTFNFKYFLFESNRVKNRDNKNKLEIIKGTYIEKYQFMERKFIIKNFEIINENNNDENIVGINNINVSNITNIIILNFPKPRIVKTKFW